MFSVMFIWKLCTSFDDRWFEFNSAVMWIFRISQGIIFGNARLTVCLQVLISFADVQVHSALGLALNHPWWPRSQVAFLALVALVAFEFERLMLSQAQLMLDARRLNRSRKLGHRLLSFYIS